MRTDRARRRLLVAAAGVALARQARAATVQRAAAYPTRPVRLIVPFSAGGATDVLGRELARQLSERLGQQVVVDNRPGAAGLLGSDIVAKAPADGYTLQIATVSTHVTAPLMAPKVPFDAREDFTPIVHVASAPNVLVLAPDVEARDVASLVTLLKARKGEMNYGSSGVGSIFHLTAELFSAMTGTVMQHVPYGGMARVFPDMLAGRVQLCFAAARSYAGDPRLRAIAVASPRPSPVLPGLPPIAETLPGFDSVSWFGLCGPRGLPPAITQRLAAEVDGAVRQSPFRARLAELGFDAGGGTGDEFKALILADTVRWSRLVSERKLIAQ